MNLELRMEAKPKPEALPTTPWLKCGCGKWFFSVAEHRAHRNNAECPVCAPDPSTPKFLEWATKVRALTKAERERKEKDRIHLEELKNDPVAQENRRKKLEEKKALRAKRRELLARGRGRK